MGKEAARLEEIPFLRRMIQPRRFFPMMNPNVAVILSKQN
jgi:hypothetical protein